MTSYSEFCEKPEFFSTEYYFSVVLPNRSVADHAQVTMKFEDQQNESVKNQSEEEKDQLIQVKTQLTKEKSQFATRKVNSEKDDEDRELEVFQKGIFEKHGKEFRKTTLAKLNSLFDRYRYEYSFNRRNIADLFGISENGASIFIKKCIDKKIIRKVKLDEYKFIDKQVDEEESK